MRLLFFVLALVSAGAAGWLAMKSMPRPAQIVTNSAQLKLVDVLVAATDINPGAEVSKESLKWVKWPENVLNPNFITRANAPDAVDKLAGTFARVRVVVNEPIYTEKFGPRSSSVLATMLSPGRRAVAVRVSAENTAGGFIVPNDHVDVMQAIVETGFEGERKLVARPILRNIRVLAIGQTLEGETEKPGGRGTAAMARTATLELTPEQAEILVAAEAKGRLSLVLRSTHDNKEVLAEEEQRARAVKVTRGGQSETVRVDGPSPDNQTRQRP